MENKQELFPQGNNLIRGVCEIHPRLLEHEFNFVKVIRGGKGCFELRWPSRVYRKDNSSLATHLKNGGGYGVQTNNSSLIVDGIKRNLVIIDFDMRELQDKVLDKFPKTFSTTSGSPKNCLHLWFATDKHEKKFAIQDKEGKTKADVLGQHGQVVSPGSLHPKGSIYRVVEDVPIVYFPYDKILEILKPFDEAPPKPIREQKPHRDYGTNSFYDLVRSNLNVIDVLQDEGINTSKNPTECPFHSSVSGSCLSFSEDVWKCHHNGCDRGGNLFNLVQELKSLTTKETFEDLAERTNLTEELKQFQSDYLKEQGGKNGRD